MRNSNAPGLEHKENEPNLDEALHLATDLARRAGELVLSMRSQRQLAIERKSEEESNIVTAADRASEELITGALTQRYPNHAIRGEEGARESGNTPYEWIIDPIDGTLNFSRGKPFSISIGLLHEGTSVLGVLHFPDDQVTLSAMRGRGAFRNGLALQRRDEIPLKHARVGFDVSSGGDELAETKTYRRPLKGKAKSVDRLYCATWGARGILEGKYDAYLCGGGLTRYDIAGASVILREGGCTMESITGDIDFSREKIPLIMATDQKLAKEILQLVKDLHNVSKQEFFRRLAQRYKKEMSVLFQGGQLWEEWKEEGTRRKRAKPIPRENWRNVVEHCLVQTAAAEELCSLLKLPAEERKAICSTAAMHDWKKRWERNHENVPTWAYDSLQSVTPNPDLLEATNPDYLEHVFVQRHEPLTPAQEIQLYLDLMTSGSEIVSTEDRIREVEVSPRSRGLEKKANGQYWQKVRELRDAIEAKLCKQLKEQGHEFPSPATIPLFLRERIEGKWKIR